MGLLKRWLPHPANVLSIVCSTGEIGSPQVVRVIGWVCDLAGTRLGWDDTWLC